MSPVTSIVHWIWCSFLGNHEKIAIYGSPVNAGPEILTFFNLFRPQNLKVTVTQAKIVQFTSLCHPSPEPLVVIVQ
jgi:hypothetical protein